MRFRIIISSALLALFLCQTGAASGEDDTTSNPPDGNITTGTLGFPFSRASAGMGPNENFINPSITVNEEYNDNVFQTHTDRKTDFLTHITPGLAFRYRAPFWDWDLAYQLDYIYYARHSRSYQINHYLDTKGNLRIIDNFLFLDISDTYQRVSLDVNRNTTVNSTFLNQSDQNKLTVAPHIEFHPGANFLVKTGYHYLKESYSNTNTVNLLTAPVDKEEHAAFISTSHELTPKSTLTTNVAYSHDDMGGLRLSYNQILPSIGIRYEITEKSFMFLEGGYSFFLFEHGPTTSGPYWNASITYNFDHMTATANSLVTYNTDPTRGSTTSTSYSGTLSKTLDRGSVGFTAGYSELRDNAINRLLSTRLWTGISLTHDLTEKLSAHLNLTGEKIDDKTIINLNNDNTAPYQFHIATGASYTMAENLSLFMDYSYTTYRHSIGSAKNNTEINRVILGVNKVF